MKFPVLWLSSVSVFFPAEVAGLAVMSIKRITVYEATKAKTAISHKETLPSAGTCRCRCGFLGGDALGWR